MRCHPDRPSRQAIASIAVSRFVGFWKTEVEERGRVVVWRVLCAPARVSGGPAVGALEKEGEEEGEDGEGVEGQESQGIPLGSPEFHGVAQDRREYEASEGAEPANPSGGPAHCLGYLLRHELEDGGIGYAHAGGHEEGAPDGNAGRAGCGQR